jgi:integrase
MACRIPKYRCYKPKNLGLVVINGKQHYLGRYGSPESVAAYKRLIQEWLVLGGASPVPNTPAGKAPSINELILDFSTRYAERHYRRPDGIPTGELDNYRDSLRPLRRLYGTTLAKHFGPLALKAVRQAMIDSGLARTTINQRVGRIVRVFKLAVENEMVPPAVYQALRAVRGLQKGRSAARDPEPVKPVSEADVEAIQPFVAWQVWAMVQLQRLTGMRPGEVCRMRTCDLDTSGAVWIVTVRSTAR